MNDKEKKYLYHIILHCLELKDIGLLTGKMGITLVLFEYGRIKKLSPILDFAEKLLDNVLNNLTIQLSLNFSNGLTGIGWGLEYLSYHRYIEICSIDVFKEIDNRLMEISPSRLKDFSLEKGFTGLLAYINSHIIMNKQIPFTQEYMNELYLACLKYNSTKHNGQTVLFEKIYNKQPATVCFDLNGCIFNKNLCEDNFCDLSLSTGLAGLLFKEISNH